MSITNLISPNQIMAGYNMALQNPIFQPGGVTASVINSTLSPQNPAITASGAAAPRVGIPNIGSQILLNSAFNRPATGAGGANITPTPTPSPTPQVPPFDPSATLAKMGGAQILGGAVKAVGSLIGGGARRREQRAAREQLAARQASYESLDTSNPYKNITNTFENLTVNTQAADFAAQQSAQGAANIMNNLAAAAGGGGVAALAQSLANSQAQAAQQASAQIGAQEQRNQLLGAQGEQRRQQLVAAGERQSQKLEFEKQGTLLGMAQQRKAAADQARKDATDALVGGIAQVGMGAAMGGFGPAGLGSIF
jgi:hypothetical protein